MLPADAGKGLTAYSAVQQSVATNAFRGSRTGGFCDTKVTQMQDFWKAKSDWPEKEAEVYISSRPAAATFPVSAFLPFSLAMGHGRFPALADGAFQVLGLFKSADD